MTGIIVDGYVNMYLITRLRLTLCTTGPELVNIFIS